MRQFLGLTGYFRHFVQNYDVTVSVCLEKAHASGENGSIISSRQCSTLHTSYYYSDDENMSLKVRIGMSHTLLASFSSLGLFSRSKLETTMSWSLKISQK